MVVWSVGLKMFDQMEDALYVYHVAGHLATSSLGTHFFIYHLIGSFK